MHTIISRCPLSQLCVSVLTNVIELFVEMPGDNCSIYGCSVSRRVKYKGTSLFKVPSGEGKFETNWRQKLVDIITKDRVIDGPLRARICNKKLFICQRHFAEDQYYRHDSKCTLNPGAIPTLNLPIKSIPSSSSAVKPRKSADSIQEKKTLHAKFGAFNCWISWMLYIF